MTSPFSASSTFVDRRDPLWRSARAGRAGGTPRVSARSSRGLTSESMSFSSSSLPCPDTWTCLIALVDRPRRPARDVVHHPADRLLVAGNLPRRKHHHVVLVELRVPVVVDGDPRERRLRLSLRSGADDRRRPATGSSGCRCRESARPAGSAGSRAAARSASCRSRPARRTPPGGRTASARSTRICIRYRLDENIATTILPSRAR